MRCIVLALIVTIAGIAPALAGQEAPAKPKSESEIAGRIERFFSVLEADKDFSGVIRIEGPDFVISRRFGKADFTTGRSHGDGVVYGAGSVTKGITAATLLALAADGLLSLDDRVARYLPAFARKNVTLSDVVRHKAGLPRDAPDGFDPESYAGGLIGWLNDQPVGDAGSYSYSNVGYEVLAAVIEAATKRPYVEIVGERILGPVGMKNSRIQKISSFVREDAARGYVAGPPPAEITAVDPVREPVGASGLVTTPEDLVLWGRAVAARRFPALFTESGMLGSFNAYSAYGHNQFWAQGTTRGHAAGINAFPAAGIYIAYVSNIETYANFGIEQVLQSIIFGEGPPAPAPRPRAVPLTDAHRALQGGYAMPQFGPATIYAEASGLHLRMEERGWTFYLTPISGARLHWRLLNVIVGEEIENGARTGLIGTQTTPSGQSRDVFWPVQ